MLGSLTIVVAHHMYSMPPYPYLATDYGTQLSLFTHHMWIGGFLIVGAAAHAAIFMVRDYDRSDVVLYGYCQEIESKLKSVVMIQPKGV